MFQGLYLCDQSPFCCRVVRTILSSQRHQMLKLLGLHEQEAEIFTQNKYPYEKVHIANCKYSSSLTKTTQR